MSAQCRRFFGSVGHGGPAAVVPAEKLIPRAGEAGIVVGVRVGEDQQKPLLLPRPAQKPVHCPQGKAVPVPPGGSELENPVVALIFPVVPVLPQHRTAADGAVGQHPDRNCAPGQRFGQNVALRRQLLLPPVLGGGGVQQNIHDQVPKGIGLLPVKHPAVPQSGGAPCKRRVDPSRAAPQAPVLLKQQNGILQLLGKALVTVTPEGAERRLVITETEAYRGEEDTACHAHRGRTKRTEMLYRGGGAVYVYLCYGIHWLMNVITGPEDFPQGVLIRACAGYEGPGKLTRYLGITGALNGADIASSPLIRIEDEGREVYIRTAKRVGIAYADEADRDRLWRFIGEVR